MFACVGKISHDWHLLQEALSARATHASPFGGMRCWGHRSWRQLANKGLLCWLWRSLLCDAKNSACLAHVTPRDGLQSCRACSSAMQQNKSIEPSRDPGHARAQLLTIEQGDRALKIACSLQEELSLFWWTICNRHKACNAFALIVSGVHGR